jgi:hypothetical protein
VTAAPGEGRHDHQRTAGPLAGPTVLVGRDDPPDKADLRLAAAIRALALALCGKCDARTAAEIALSLTEGFTEEEP